MKKNIIKVKPKSSPAKNTETKKESYTIPPECASFDEVPANFSQNLDLSNKFINTWAGILKHESLVSLDISGTKISDFKGTNNLPSLKTLKFLNTPLRNLPYSQISAIYAFGYQLNSINDETISKTEIEHLKGHPLSQELQQKIRAGFILCSYPKYTITDINQLVCTGEAFMTRKKSLEFENNANNILNKEFSSQDKTFNRQKSQAVLSILRSYNIGNVQNFISYKCSNKGSNSQKAVEDKIAMIEQENAQLKAQKLKFIGIFQKLSKDNLDIVINDKAFEQQEMISQI